MGRKDLWAKFGAPALLAVALWGGAAGQDAVVGYATISAGAGSRAPVAAALFSLRQEGVLVSEAGVGAVESVRAGRVFVDQEGTQTGLALVNPGETALSLALTLRFADGRIAARDPDYVLSAGGQISLFVEQLFDQVPEDFQTGSLTFEANSAGEGAAAVTIRLSLNARNQPLFATLPVVDLGGSPGDGSIVFPHLGAGGILSTQILLINRSAERARGTVRFTASDGSPLELAADGAETSSVAYDLAADGVQRVDLTSSAGIVQGYAVVAADEGPTPAGTAIFQFRDPSGRLISEAGVGAAVGTRRARVFVDTVGTRTGVAVAGPGAAEQTVEFELYDRNGVRLEEASRRLPADGHLAIFADELFPGLPPGFTGVMEIRSETPVVPVTLKLTANQRGDPILTTLPIADLDHPSEAALLILPQIGFGQGLSTRLILIHPGGGGDSGGVVATADQAGEPLALPVSGATTSQVEFRLAPGGGRQLRPGNSAAPARIFLDPANPAFLEVAVNLGDSRYVRPLVVDSAGEFRDDYELSFSSLDPAVATIDSSGEIRGLEAGFSTLTISTGGAVETAVVAVSDVAAGPAAFQIDGLAQDLSGRIYLASSLSNAILRAPELAGPAEAYAGIEGMAGFRDDARLRSLFSSPRFLALNQVDGSLYVSDSDNHRIRQVGAGEGGRVSTLAGSDGPGGQDGAGAAASFRNPAGVALDDRGSLWVADAGNHTIRRISLISGEVATIAGMAGVAGASDGVGSEARFDGPAGITFEPEPLARQLERALLGGPPPPVSLIVADAGNGAIRRVFEDGRVETLSSTATAAARSWFGGRLRNQAAGRRVPETAAIDPSGTIYVSFPEEGAIEAFLPNGQVAPVAQPDTFTGPRGLSLNQAGALLVADAGGLQRVRYGAPVIEGVDPVRTRTGGGVRVTVTGRNFAPETIVILSGAVISGFEEGNSGALSFVAPPLPSGRLTLTVQNRGGLAQTEFLVEPPALAELDAGGITTVAGGGTFVGDGGSAAQAALSFPAGLVLDALGDLIIGDTFNHRIRRVVGSAGIINTIAGSGLAGFEGDGGPAPAASLDTPGEVVASPSGDIHFVDRLNGRVRRVNRGDGTISTVAGNGIFGPFGDGGPATDASLSLPTGIAFNREGDLFIADTGNLRVRRVEADTGVITTVAGDGLFGAAVDGLPATESSLALPEAVAVDADGGLLISDTQHHLIRRVDPQSGVMSTVAGSGVAGFSGDGGAASEAALNRPGALIVDVSGDLIFADRGNNRIRRVSSGVIETVAGDGSPGFFGDGGPAREASLSSPSALASDAAGSLWIADSGAGRIRRANSADGTIETVVGSGMANIPGDGGPAFAGGLSSPFQVSFDPAGNLLIVETGVNRLRRVDGATGTISTIAGTGFFGMGGEAAPAVDTPLGVPVAAVSDASGNIYLTERAAHRVRRIDAATGLIATVAGNGETGFSGDGGPALEASFGEEAPWGLALDWAGRIYASDTGNHRVRRVDPQTGQIETVAGDGTAGFSGDGGPASEASLNFPRELFIDARDNLYIVDSGNRRIRRVDSADGAIRTVAGGGSLDPASGPVLALDASFSPVGVAVDGDGNLVLSDNLAHRVWMIDAADQSVRLIAGNGSRGLGGDGGNAAAANLCLPRGVALDGDGNLYIVDFCNNRIRAVRAPF